MEIIRGKQTSTMDARALVAQLSGYHNIHVDIGTGDGRFVRYLAQTQPRTFAIGIDACRENLVEVSRRADQNTLFVIANARALPPELDGLTARISINFPWGSLLDGLLNDEPGLMAGLRAIARPDAALEVRLNGGALAEAGWPLDAGTAQVQDVLAANGFEMRPMTPMTACDLKACPTTWAKRLAFGRDPRAVYLRGVRVTEQVSELELA